MAVDPAFRERGLDGTFVLLDLKRGSTRIVGRYADQAFLPFSTFKVVNALVGLETGVIPDQHFSLKWDGRVHARLEMNRDHDLQSAMKESVVWFYQEVARRTGAPRMQAQLGAMSYGNGDLSAGIDRFWLEGAFRVTPRAQVDFLSRLRARALPASVAHMELVEKLIHRETTDDGWTLRGKTGFGQQDGQNVGWLVGLVDHGEDAWAYATLVLGPTSGTARMLPLREPLTKELLARHGAWRATR